MAHTRETILPKLMELIEPLNRRGIALTGDTSFASDLELDSLTVMDLVANIEDEYDIILPMNLLPELETIGQLADAVARIVNG
ncbi:acyl carrier protein [Sphingosinicella soli]|uniref:Acyl carrier protein n=1 Tax=Sphingosinicella soli TaxID=333708 RepID=A0A7W7B3R9_9SPHN|nr:acyl carrier protein [Sphingosinicella soli]MBB4632505.1 acyl carrier protein [Sphingosinicella soli]